MAERRKTRPIRMTDAEWDAFKRRGPKWLRAELAKSSSLTDSMIMSAMGGAFIKVWFDGEQIRTELVPVDHWRTSEVKFKIDKGE